MENIAVDVNLEPITEGIIHDGVISLYSTLPSSLSYAENLHNDTIGVMSVRPAVTTKFTPTATPLSTVMFQDISGNNYLLWQEGGSLKYVGADNPGSVTTHTSVLDATLQARYSIIGGYVLMTENNDIKYFNIATGPTALGITVPANTNLINAGFGGRIWYGSTVDGTNRLYYSDVIPSGGVTSVTGTAPYLVINASNGDYLTALVRTQQALFVFTSNGIFRVYNTQSQDNSPCANVGTVRQESVTETKDGFYFYHPSGFYKLNSDGSAQNISSRISTILPTQAVYNINNCTAWSVLDHVYFAFPLGSNGGTTIYRYSISTQVWTIYKLQSMDVLCAAVSYPRPVSQPSLGGIARTPQCYILGTDAVNTRFAGTFVENLGDGTIGTQVGSLDLGTYPIFTQQVTQWKIFGKDNHIKQIFGLSFDSQGCAGMDISYQVDGEQDWRPVGSLDFNSVTFFRDFVSVPFTKIRFKVSGQAYGQVGTYVQLSQPTILKLVDIGYPTNNYGN